MTYTFTVSPDFPPGYITDWYIFNTFLQRQLGEHIHLELYDRFDEQRAAIEAGEIDLIYANPFDAATLVRDHGFKGVSKPVGSGDEAVVVVPKDSPVTQIEDLAAGCRVVVTDDPDVRLIGMIMLEPADLTSANIESLERPTYVLVAKSLLDGDADVGVFLSEAYGNLSRMTREGLRPLVASQIGVISHMLMIGPDMAGHQEAISALCSGMGSNDDQQRLVQGLGFDGWEPVLEEETEFMIDLMDTLLAD